MSSEEENDRQNLPTSSGAEEENDRQNLPTSTEAPHPRTKKQKTIYRPRRKTDVHLKYGLRNDRSHSNELRAGQRWRTKHQRREHPSEPRSPDFSKKKILTTEDRWIGLTIGGGVHLGLSRWHSKRACGASYWRRHDPR